MSKYKYRYELYSVSQGEYYKCRRTHMKDNFKEETSPIFSLEGYSLTPKQASTYDSYVSIQELLADSRDIILIGTYTSAKELKEELDELLLIEELKK